MFIFLSYFIWLDDEIKGLAKRVIRILCRKRPNKEHENKEVGKHY